MNTFNFKEWENQKVVMHCSTKEEAEDFCRVMHEAGKKWCNGAPYLNSTEWDDYKENTCYRFNNDSFGSLQLYKNDNYLILEWSSYMNKSFTLSDLKNGDVIVYRNGKVNIVCTDTGTCITPNSGFNSLKDTKDDLSDYYCPSYDIVDIYRPTAPHHCSFSEHLYKEGKHVFHRNEEPIEITLEEIAKLKGVSVDRIKIVK